MYYKLWSWLVKMPAAEMLDLSVQCQKHLANMHWKVRLGWSWVGVEVEGRVYLVCSG